MDPPGRVNFHLEGRLRNVVGTKSEGDYKTDHALKTISYTKSYEILMANSRV